MGFYSNLVPNTKTCNSNRRCSFVEKFELVLNDLQIITYISDNNWFNSDFIYSYEICNKLRGV